MMDLTKNSLCYKKGGLTGKGEENTDAIKKSCGEDRKRRTHGDFARESTPGERVGSVFFRKRIRRRERDCR